MTELAQAAEGVASQDATAEAVVFWIFAVVGLGAAIAMITMKNIVHSALMLVLNFLSIAALYLALQSGFLGIIQVIVYAGAIMVLFLFVIMLLGVDRDDLLFESKRWHVIGAVLGGVLVASALLFAFSGTLSASSRCGAQAESASTLGRCIGLDEALAETEQGSVGFVGESMFNRYTFPFEAAALLLVVATIGALVLGRRHDPVAEEDPLTAGSSDDHDRPGADATVPEGTPSDADRLLGEPDAGEGGR